MSLTDIKGLAALKAVVELGGVKEAGDRLNVGQPAITKRLRSLDSCFGVTVMQREGRRLELTPAGEKVYAYARLVIDHQTLLVEDLNALRLGEKRLRLVVNSAIGEHLLPELLFSFADAYPEYRIESRMDYTRQIPTRLATGLADLALLEQAPDHPDIMVQRWLDDELLLVCGPTHPLYNMDLLPVTALERLDYVLREPQSAMRILLDKALNDIGIHDIKISMEVGSTDTIVEILDRGRHVSFLPRFAVADALAREELFHVKIQGLRVKRTLWIARTRSNMSNPVAESFIQVLRQKTPTT